MENLPDISHARCLKQTGKPNSFHSKNEKKKVSCSLIILHSTAESNSLPVITRSNHHWPSWVVEDLIQDWLGHRSSALQLFRKQDFSVSITVSWRSHRWKYNTDCQQWKNRRYLKVYESLCHIHNRHHQIPPSAPMKWQGVVQFFLKLVDKKRNNNSRYLSVYPLTIS